MEKLDRAFYLRDTVTVARELLGKRLCHWVGGALVAVEITETEAYTGVEDKACHSYGGRRTRRTQELYREGGHAYVYFIYGMYDLFNVVTESAQAPCAVLVRGARPVPGCEDAIAWLRFRKEYGELTPAQRRGLLDGPGKVCRGLGITREHNGMDLLGEELFIGAGASLGREFSIGVGKRINIGYAMEAADFPYRFYCRFGDSDCKK